MAQIRLIPSAYTRSNTSRVTVTNETNMYNNTDHTANYCSIRGRNNTSNTYYCFIHGFNIGDVPSDAIVSNISVKIRCYKNDYLATGSAYRLRLASTPSSSSAINNTTMTEDIETTATVYTIPIGSLSWEDIKSYGSNFSIEVPLMSIASSYPYLYVYGAEIEVTYTIPIYHDVTASSNVSDVTIVPTSETLIEGNNIVFSILSQNSSSFIITDNGIDVTNQIVQIQPIDSKQFIPSGYTNLSSGITINSSYPITRAYQNSDDSTDYARLDFDASTTGYIELLFGIEGIPSDATISSISAKARLRISNTTRMTNRICQLYSGSTAKGSNTNFSSTSGAVVTLTPGTWTINELSDLRMRIGATSSSSTSSKYLYIYGADITIEYILNGELYTYTISNIVADHTIVVDDVNKLFIKTNGTYLRAKKIFKNINGVWTEIDIESLTDNNVYIYGGVITTNQD